MKQKSNKLKMTKVLMTATLCAVLMLGAAACNNDTTANNNNMNTDAPVVSDDPIATEPIAPEDGNAGATE